MTVTSGSRLASSRIVLRARGSSSTTTNLKRSVSLVSIIAQLPGERQGHPRHDSRRRLIFQFQACPLSVELAQADPRARQAHAFVLSPVSGQGLAVVEHF